MNCTIDLATDGRLELHIPSESGGSQIVTIPPTEAGMKVLLRVLRARQDAPDYHNGRKLNTDSEPSQALIREWLKADREAKVKEAQAVILAQLDFNVEINL